MGDSKGIQKILRNPAIGLIYLLVFSLLVGQTDVRLATGIALLLSIVGRFLIKKHSRSIHTISVITFAIALPLSFFVFPKLSDIAVFVFVEVIFVLALFSMYVFSPGILLRQARNKNPLTKNYLAESFRVSLHSQYGLTIHLLIISLYFSFISAGNQSADHLVVVLSCQLTLITIYVLESIRLKILDKKLIEEEWLPVVTEQGNVTGKVAKSVTKDLKNKFMHPVVRVALIYKGCIYLKNRGQGRLLNPGMLDYPFEKYMHFNHEIDEAVHNSIRKECGSDDLPLRFLLKYIFENDTTKRLIFLFVSEIEDDNIFNQLHLSDGKLWTEAQIEDNLGANIFSECFELEFEYLKNTTLLAYRLRSQKKSG